MTRPSRSRAAVMTAGSLLSTPWRLVHMGRRDDEDPFAGGYEFLCQAHDTRRLATGPGDGYHLWPFCLCQGRTETGNTLPEAGRAFRLFLLIYDSFHLFPLSK